MAPHSSTLAWRIPWAEEPGRLLSMGSQSQTRLSDFTFTFSSLNHKRTNLLLRKGEAAAACCQQSPNLFLGFAFYFLRIIGYN